MRTRKIAILALTFFLLVMAIVPFVHSTTEYTITSYEDNLSTLQLRDTHPSNTVYLSAAGETFTSLFVTYEHLTGAEFYLAKYSTANATLSARVYATTAGAPTGAALASSDNLNTTILTASPLKYRFNFTGANSIEITQNVVYWIGVIVVGDLDGSEGQYPYIYMDDVSPSYSGTGYSFANSAWVASATWDCNFIVYGTDPVGGSTEDETPGGVLLTQFANFIVPVVVLLLPAAILCFITRRIDKWLIILGVTIGAGLGVYFSMIPVWLLFLVVVGLIGMVYQSVRSGG